MKPKVYLYPITVKKRKNEKGVYNPYKDNFMLSMGEYLEFVYQEKPSSASILNVLKFIPKLDYLFLNWIEDLPDKKWGYLQSLLFLVLLRLKGWFNLKVVWTLHNKISHNPKNRRLKRILFGNLLKRSDLIITHAREGADFAESARPGTGKKIFYFVHPIIPFHFDVKHTGKVYDFLIWGALSPYKGIDIFLKNLWDAGLDQSFKIKIVGKAMSSDFFQKLNGYKNNMIQIEDAFVNHEDLAQLIDESHCVLFTYSGESVLSSGALIDSVAHRATVVGPYVGAFKEMADMGIIKAYNHFDEIPQILAEIKEENPELRLKKISQFIQTHTWEEFSKALNSHLTSLNKKSAK